VGERLKPAVC